MKKLLAILAIALASNTVAAKQMWKTVEFEAFMVNTPVEFTLENATDEDVEYQLTVDGKTFDKTINIRKGRREQVSIILEATPSEITKHSVCTTPLTSESFKFQTCMNITLKWFTVLD
ncbi:hypothetical protein [Vibrio harveyi]|uniref:hypothetical protein n=1 Tax=Vibrio harveyi TaxID=669 RepID=UPI0018F17EA6|nr:hypothetical protein [Vibrio harveyi]